MGCKRKTHMERRLWLNVVTGYGADPAGVTDSTAAISQALSDSGNMTTPVPVYLPSGTYKTTAPLTVPPGVTLLGASGNMKTSGNSIKVAGVARFGTIIFPDTTWSAGASYPAVILLDGTSAPGIGQKVINVVIDGGNLPAGVSGIASANKPTQVLLQDVLVHLATNHGIDASNGGGSWVAVRVATSSSANDGFRLGVPGLGVPDSTFTDCVAIGNGADGWHMFNPINCRFTGCRAEWNGRYGYYVGGDTTATGGVQLTGCSTDRNKDAGLYTDAAGSWPILVTGMMLRRDGRLGTTYPAVHISGAICPVILDGITVFPGWDDGGNNGQPGNNQSPAHGIQVDGTVTYVSATNAYLHTVNTGW